MPLDPALKVFAVIVKIRFDNTALIEFPAS